MFELFPWLFPDYSLNRRERIGCGDSRPSDGACPWGRYRNSRRWRPHDFDRQRQRLFRHSTLVDGCQHRPAVAGRFRQPSDRHQRDPSFIASRIEGLEHPQDLPPAVVARTATAFCRNEAPPTTASLTANWNSRPVRNLTERLKQTVANCDWQHQGTAGQAHSSDGSHFLRGAGAPRPFHAV